MSKYKRIEIGAVMKSSEKGKPDYIKISNDVELKKGDYLNLESKQSKIDGINAAVENGKMSAETAEKLLEYANKIPDFVRFQIVKLNKEE